MTARRMDLGPEHDAQLVSDRHCGPVDMYDLWDAEEEAE